MKNRERRRGSTDKRPDTQQMIDRLLTSILPNRVFVPKSRLGREAFRSFRKRLTDHQTKRYQRLQWLDDPVVKLRLWAAEADEAAEAAKKAGKPLDAARWTRVASQIEKKSMQLVQENPPTDLAQIEALIDLAERIKKEGSSCSPGGAAGSGVEKKDD